jgi:hypothetical protein
MKDQSAHEDHCVWPSNSPCFTCRKMVEGARFKNSEASETIGPDLSLSFQSQSLPDESEAREEQVKPDRAR